MDDLTAKVRTVEKLIAMERGPFNFFALMEREDLFDRWDLVISAPWARENMETFGYVADFLRQHMESDMRRLARIVVLDANEEPMLSLTERFAVEHGELEFNEARRFGLPVRSGYIITSRRAA
jgi:hypothetical protein